MTRTLASLALALTFFILPALALTPGTAAPNFNGTDSTGTQQTLSQYRGKYVAGIHSDRDLHGRQHA